MSRKSRENEARQRELATDPQRIADRLSAAARQHEQSGREIRQLVVLAREARMSWTVIGELLGVTRQSARERYIDLDPLKGHGLDARTLGIKVEGNRSEAEGGS